MLCNSGESGISVFSLIFNENLSFVSLSMLSVGLSHMEIEEYIPYILYFFILLDSVSRHYTKELSFPVLKDRSCVEDETCCLTFP